MRIIIFILLTIVLSCHRLPETLFLPEDAINSFFRNSSYSGFKKEVAGYYEKRNGEYIWFNSGGLNEYGRAFLKRLHEDTLGLNGLIADTDARIRSVKNKRLRGASDSTLTFAELMLTTAFFKFSDVNWTGSSASQMKRSGWRIRSKSPNGMLLLDSVLHGDPDNIIKFEPVYSQHKLLKTKLEEYLTLTDKGWNDLPVVPLLHPGDKAVVIARIRKNLHLTGDMREDNGSEVYDESFAKGISSFQKRNGLEPTGVIDDATKERLQQPLRSVIQTLKANIERSIWFPQKLKDDNVVVNIPAYELYVINNDKLQWKCNVVVGSDTTNTLVFNDVMEYIVINPYWNIPPGIIYKETIPAILEDAGYLEAHNMEIVDDQGNAVDPSSIKWQNINNDFNYTIRQKPGPGNALGKIKFLLPNSHNIYLHDTPAKSLFGENDRAFSHGCVRVSEPLRLAEYLLRNEGKWNAASIKDAIDSGEELFIKLNNKVPVYLTYFTAWVDEKGDLQIRGDIYNYDYITAEQSGVKTSV